MYFVHFLLGYFDWSILGFMFQIILCYCNKSTKWILIGVYFLLLHYIFVLFFCFYPQDDKQAKKHFNLSWLILQISYHRFKNLAELLKGDLATKIGRGIFSKDLIDRKCNCSLPSKVNGKCAYEGKC